MKILEFFWRKISLQNSLHERRKIRCKIRCKFFGPCEKDAKFVGWNSFKSAKSTNCVKSAKCRVIRGMCPNIYLFWSELSNTTTAQRSLPLPKPHDDEGYCGLNISVAAASHFSFFRTLWKRTNFAEIRPNPQNFSWFAISFQFAKCEKNGRTHKIRKKDASAKSAKKDRIRKKSTKN